MELTGSMKLVATIANTIPLSFLVYLFISDDLRLRNLFDFFALLSLGLVPILNLIALHTYHGERWLDLFLKRKALEEQRKIDEIQNPKQK